MDALLLGHLGQGRQDRAVLLQAGDVAQGVDSFEAGNGEVGGHLDPTHAAGLRPQPGGGGLSLDAGAPDDGGGGDPFPIGGDSPGLDIVHPGVQPHLDADLGQRVGGVGRQVAREGGEQGRPRLDQDHLGPAGVDAAEVVDQGVAGQLGDRAGHLHTRGPAADHHDGEQGLAEDGVGLDLRPLEGAQQAGADGPRVLDGLQARGMDRPVVVTQIVVHRAGGQDQGVVGEVAAIGQLHLAGLGIDAHHLTQHRIDIGIGRQHLADRSSDVSRRQGGGGHLIEQGHEQVVVAPVDEGDPDLGLAQGLGGGEPAEPAANDHHMRRVAHRGGGAVEHVGGRVVGHVGRPAGALRGGAGVMKN